MRTSPQRKLRSVAAGLASMATALVFLCSCSRDEAPPNQVLIYCGITMFKPMHEIATAIGEREGYEILINKGGSQNLQRSIEKSKMGDLYLPGSESYMENLTEKGLITEQVHVGYNKAAMMVQKGNPKNIAADLSLLTSKDIKVVIGNPSSGSIGRETKSILEKRGILDRVMENAVYMTTDSKGLAAALREKKADLVINWFAASTWPRNADAMEVIPIDERYAKKKRLVLGLLSVSRHPEISRKIMRLAASEEGKRIFNKYGLYETE